MNKLIYSLLVVPLSLLPLKVLYLLEPFGVFVLDNIIGYRKEVIQTNLKNSFPDKSDRELASIQRGFYHNFILIILEYIKCFGLTRKSASKMGRIVNPEVMDSYLKQGKSCWIFTGHFGNWEMLTYFGPLYHDEPIYGIYEQLRNSFWEKVLKKSREKFGSRLIRRSEVGRVAADLAKSPGIIAAIADQSPTSTKRLMWLDFLTQRSAFSEGLEFLPRRYRIPVFYGEMLRLPDKTYNLEFKLICEDPSTMQRGEITKKYIEMLEESINKSPEQWLWSHRRWKIKPPEDDQKPS